MRHAGPVSQPTLTTERLTLRAWNPDDPDDVSTAFDLYRRDEVARWLGTTPDPWPDETVARDRLLRWQVSAEEEPGFGILAVVPDSGRPVGSGLLKHLPDAEGAPTPDVEVGWHLHPDVWGNGYATELGLRLIDHARTLGIDVVHAVAYADNEPSLAVMRRLGMIDRGMTDRWYGVQVRWFSTP
jgi:RimJ/RimL family protein N-acetyltransferase